MASSTCTCGPIPRKPQRASGCPLTSRDPCTAPCTIHGGIVVYDVSALYAVCTVRTCKTTLRAIPYVRVPYVRWPVPGVRKNRSVKLSGVSAAFEYSFHQETTPAALSPRGTAVTPRPRIAFEARESSSFIYERRPAGRASPPRPALDMLESLKPQHGTRVSRFGRVRAAQHRRTSNSNI